MSRGFISDLTPFPNPAARPTTATMYVGDALMSDRPRVATVTSGEPSRALVVTDRDFKALVSRTPQIALKVLQAVGERLLADDEQR